jgi:uncharacterized protein DUF5916/TonB-dependent receptor-like protein
VTPKEASWLGRRSSCTSPTPIDSSPSTDAKGEFSLIDLPAGNYRVLVRWKGGTATARAQLKIQPGDHLHATIRIASAGGEVEIEVPSDADQAHASGGEHLSSREVSGLPLNKRDFSQLLLLAAGTMTDTNGSANFTQQFAVNGQRGSTAMFAMDGVDTTDPELGGATFSNFNVDAVQEIESLSGVMPAEIGHGAAGYTNIITKSGTDHLHGSVFEFVRNAAFDARNFFDRRTLGNPGRIPPFARNEFGFALGGPVELPGVYQGRDRTFFFGQYQGFRQVLGSTQVIAVPTAAERQGQDATAFPGDTLNVPVNPQVAPILAGYPLPNDPQGPFGGRTYATSTKVATDSNQFSVRIDHRISDRAQLMTRFNLNNVNGPLTNPSQPAIDQSFAIHFFDHRRNAALRYTRTVSPHFTAETSIGYIRSTQNFNSPNLKSLRIPATEEQTWGIVFVRWIVRNNESATWPRVSTRIEGRMSQEATLKGLRGISPGHGGMLIPYAYLRSFRTPDQSIPNDPHFESKSLDPRVGADAKVVLKRSFSLDVTANPDFSQVESDLPQITVNRRFQVYFPEKRPFFLENPSFFETALDLMFTRNIADPQFGARLTGKEGPWAVGALLADDRSPGESVAPGDPLEGKRAFYSVLRVNRDIFRQSTLGAIYTNREFAGTHNRVGGVDTRFKIMRNWWVIGQAVSSSTTLPDGSNSAGPAYKAQARFDGRTFYSNAEFDDLSLGFNTLTGFISIETVERPINVGRTITRPPLRPDFHGASEIALYRFRPEGKYLISWGPTVFVNPVWDHHGNPLDMYQDYTMSWEFTGQTAFELYYQADREMLRPQDFRGLTANEVFSHHRQGVYFETALLQQATFKVDYSQGAQINVVPPSGRLPVLANVSTGSLSLVFRPERRLRMENTYLLDRLTDAVTGASVFTNHIIRSTCVYQFNKMLSLRIIPQYTTVLANPLETSLSTSKTFNTDFLFTYLLNPFTALYVGYNQNMDNLELLSGPAAAQLLRTRGLSMDGKQFFVKFSYLFRF